MDGAFRVRDIYKAENARLESVDSVKGRQFAAHSDQVKLMQTERIQLLQQIDSEKGQKELANQTMMDQKQMILDLHQQIADLRKRQGFLTLQEEKKAALETAEIERQNAERLQHELDEAQATSAERQISLDASHNDFQAAQAALADLMERLEAERLQKAHLEAANQALNDQSTAWKTRCEEAEATLSSTLESIQAAATRKAASPPAPPTDTRASSDAAVTKNGSHDYFAPNGNSNTNGHISDKQIVDEPATTSPRPDSQTTSPRSPSSHPWSPSLSPSEGGFRTIHGQHRADGSLGGYRAGKGIRRISSGGVNRILSPGSERRAGSMASNGSGSNSRGSVGGSVQTPREEDEDLYGL